VFGLLRRSPDERIGFQLYGAAVAAAREPYYYSALGVPDTLNGRFDLVGLHTCIVIRRLRRAPPPGPSLAQSVFDAMFSDMDVNLRELGVSDLSVGKRVRVMWEAFHGRAVVYEAALEAADIPKLADALTRNVWADSEPADGSPERLARIALAQDRYISGQDLAVLSRGSVAFLPAAAAV
jgi:cytochrome b pre-mRNA-processing protein 3